MGILILALIIVASVLVGLLIYFLKKDSIPAAQVSTSTITNNAIEDVEHIFNDEFREELRNRGRLHFEKIIGENAMFLQQDLRLTTSQLNDYMKQEITRTLKNEFSKYEESINNAKQLAVESIEKTQATIDQQRQLMTQQLSDQFSAEKTHMISRFENHMADVVNHYIMTAIGNQIDLSDQLEFILKDLKDNKEAIIEDIKNGA
ncbi:hypothetical protein EB118_01530 [bacterium]|nr:hypothetical protein [bacterium]NBX98541.1 hypothetical protein [bacterium]NDC93824.1 hypothetical protein [bacterium]NDD83615.1 hypothetical protein [bacterium]NDG28771.1 hypothetical protein [bacterium]